MTEELRSHLFQRVASFLLDLLTKIPYLKVWGSHLFQRVASFLLFVEVFNVVEFSEQFSSLSESGFIPTRLGLTWTQAVEDSSHLFQRVASFLLLRTGSGTPRAVNSSHLFQRVASFLRVFVEVFNVVEFSGSHLFQRVASFLPWGALFFFTSIDVCVLISFREWLHSYNVIL